MSGELLIGLDTATAETSVAAWREGELLAERRVGPGEGGRPRHARALLGAVEETVAEAGGWPVVGRIVAGVGPGSFTGVRIGVATARALAQGRGLSLAGIPSPAALAYGLPSGRDRLGLIDARRGELFAVLARAGEQQPEEPRRLRPEQIGELVEDLRSPLAAGDGAIRFRQELEAAGVEVPADTDPLQRLAAGHLCALASGREGGAPEKLVPIYLRKPDAAIWRERDGKH